MKKDLRAERERQRVTDNKRFILESAEKIFGLKGFTQTTMDEIADEAQFSKATVYRYFNSKQEIFREIILISLQEAQQNIQAIKQQDISAEKRLQSLIRYILEYFHKKKKIARTFFMEKSTIRNTLALDVHDHYSQLNKNSKLPVEFKSVFEDINNTIREIIQDGIENGEFRSVDSNEAWYILGSMLRGFHFQEQSLDKEYSRDESAKILLDFFLYGLKCPHSNQEGENI